MTEALINTQITILFYLAVGFILYKAKIFTPHAQVFVSDMSINVLLPCSVLASFLRNMSIDLLISLIVVLFAAIILEGSLYLFTKVKIPYFEDSEAAILHYGSLVSNGGLIGTPVIEALFGSLGVMYCNVFLVPARILAYSAGESIFNPAIKRGPKAIIYSVITNKIIIAMAIGLLLTALNISLPSPIMTGLSAIGASMSPFSLMLVGSMLAQNLHISKDTILKVSFITIFRLIIIPTISLIFCLILKFDFMTTATIVLLMGMPVGSSTASFAKRYKGNEEFASSAVLVSTLLSTVTLVILMQFMEMIF